MAAYDENMPSSYDTQHIGHTPDWIDRGYALSMAGILMIVQIVLSLITFICGAIDDDFVKHHGGGWILFVSMSAVIICIILYVFYAFMIIHRMPATIPRPLLEMGYYVTYTVFYFICGIVASVKGDIHPSVGACAFFSFACMVAFGIDAFFKVMTWRSGPPTVTISTGASNTSTVTSTASASASPPTTDIERQQY